MKARALKNFVRLGRTKFYRMRQEATSEHILIGYVGCGHCDDAIPVYTIGLDVREDEDGDMALCAPLDLSDLELHRMSHTEFQSL